MSQLTVSASRRPLFRASPRRVHVATPGSFPYLPLCGAAKTTGGDMHFVIDMNQVYTHRQICPDCAGHEDIAMLVLGEL